MIDSAVYPCIFEKSEGGYLVTVPDIDVCTFGKNMQEAIAMARDVIQLHILTCEEEGLPITPPNTIKKSKLPKGAVCSYVDVVMPEYRERYGSKSVKKNCTIPAWMATKAQELNINFSKTLQDALMLKIQAMTI